MNNLLKPLLDGEILYDLSEPGKIRAYALKQVTDFAGFEPWPLI